MKKLFVSLLVIVSLFVTSQAFASTTVQPPTSVGTYVDFNHSVRLQWKPAYSAASYNVYLAEGYNAQTGFTLQYNLNNYALRYINRQWVIQSYVSTPKIGWYTIRVTSVDKDGSESAPCSTSVNVWR